MHAHGACVQLEVDAGGAACERVSHGVGNVGMGEQQSQREHRRLACHLIGIAWCCRGQANRRRADLAVHLGLDKGEQLHGVMGAVSQHAGKTQHQIRFGHCDVGLHGGARAADPELAPVKAIPGITQHMLTAQLRELEEDGLVSRTVFAEVPPRVEYEITQKARGLGPTMEALTAWWQTYGSGLPSRPTSRGRKAKVG